MDDVRSQQAQGADAAASMQHMQLLLDVSRNVAALDSLDAVLDALVAVAAEQTDADRATLYLVDPDTGELYSRIAQGIGRREIRLGQHEGIAGTVFKEGRALIIDDAYADERFMSRFDSETGFKTKTILAAPIRTPKGKVIGVIQVLNKTDGIFSDKDRDCLLYTSDAADE